MTTGLVHPPDLPPSIDRHSVLIGPPGTGKSHALRVLARDHAGPSVALSLVDVVGPLARANNLTLERTQLVPRMLALLLIAAVEATHDRASLSALRALLPHVVPRAGDLARRLAAARRKVATLSAPLPEPSFLLEALDAQAGAHALWSAPLMVIDDLDLLPPSVGAAAFDLSALRRWRVVLACRPSASSWAQAGWQVLPFPARPRSDEWCHFMEAVIERRAPGVRDRVRDGEWAQLLALSGGSLAIALALGSAAVRTRSARQAWQEVLATTAMLQRFHMRTVQSTSQAVGAELQRVIGEVRGDVLQMYGAIPGPVVLGIQRGSRVRTHQRAQALVGRALRAGTLVPAESYGDLECVQRFEVHPLLMWTPTAPFWALGSERAVTLTRTEGLLLHRRVVHRQARSLGWIQSRTAPPPGGPRPSQLRLVEANDRSQQRLTWVHHASVLAIDGNVVSRDLAHHLGIALALGRDRVFVAGSPERVPGVLRLGIVRTVSAAVLEAQLRAELARHNRRVPPVPIPGSLVWIGGGHDALAMLPTVAADIVVEVVDWSAHAPASTEDLARIASAQIVVLEQTRDGDDLRPWLVAGMHDAVPHAGYDRARLRRLLIVVSGDMRELPPNARRIAPGEALGEIRQIASDVARWRRSRG